MTRPSVALLDRSSVPVTARLDEVAQALQTQVDRDLGPVWGVGALILPWRHGAPGPGCWRIVVVDSRPARLGVRVDRSGCPCAEVRAGGDWTVAASHALLEMLVDPAGARFMPARGARYLVEACDPCEVHTYPIGGVEVSDFVTPDYYRPDRPMGAVDFLRALREPLEVPAGGSLSWQDAEDGRLHQRCPDGRLLRSARPFDPVANPRQDRDQAFPDHRGRHDLPAIRRRHAARERRAS
jgi:hypothetical protein